MELSGCGVSPPPARLWFWSPDVVLSQLRCLRLLPPDVRTGQSVHCVEVYKYEVSPHVQLMLRQEL